MRRVEESAALFAFSWIKIIGDGRTDGRTRTYDDDDCRVSAEARWRRSGWSTAPASVISPLPLALRFCFCRFPMKQITKKERNEREVRTPNKAESDSSVFFQPCIYLLRPSPATALTRRLQQSREKSNLWSAGRGSDKRAKNLHQKCCVTCHLQFVPH